MSRLGIERMLAVAVSRELPPPIIHTTYIAIRPHTAGYQAKCSCGWIGQGLDHPTLERAHEACDCHEDYWAIARNLDLDEGVEDYW
jgi:hypothetical protein